MTDTMVETLMGVYYSPKQVANVIRNRFPNKELAVQAYCSFVEEADNYSSDPDTELYWAVELYRFLGE